MSSQTPGISSSIFGQLRSNGKTKSGPSLWYSFWYGWLSLDWVPSFGSVASRQFTPLKNCWISNAWWISMVIGTFKRGVRLLSLEVCISDDTGINYGWVGGGTVKDMLTMSTVSQHFCWPGMHSGHLSWTKKKPEQNHVSSWLWLPSSTVSSLLDVRCAERSEEADTNSQELHNMKIGLQQRSVSPSSQCNFGCRLNRNLSRVFGSNSYHQVLYFRWDTQDIYPMPLLE